MSLPGELFIVATPIGNLSDISKRAVEILSSVDLIAAEDTRHSGKLMQHLAIDTRMIALHEHNEEKKRTWVLEKLNEGLSIALISDAGTPLISDPGYPLVTLCRDNDIKVTPIPGPCAITTALCAAGLPTDSFQFIGFLPVKSVAKKTKLEEIGALACTQVFYESPRRVVDTVGKIGEVIGPDREIVIAKELTKSFETFKKGCAAEILSWFAEDEARTKGEFVVMLAPASRVETGVPAEAQSLLQDLATELPLKKAAAIVAKHYQLKKNELYKLGLELGL